jgi:hypothetical protein
MVDVRNYELVPEIGGKRGMSTMREMISLGPRVNQEGLESLALVLSLVGVSCEDLPGRIGAVSPRCGR